MDNTSKLSPLEWRLSCRASLPAVFECIHEMSEISPLSQQTKRAFLLRFNPDGSIRMTYSELADELGFSYSKTVHRVNRAITYLRHGYLRRRYELSSHEVE